MKIKKTSKQPRKVRKRMLNAPLHKKAALVRAHLSKELRQRLKKRSARLKKGDTVKVLRGRFKGSVGKVVDVSLSKGKVFLEGKMQKKQSGKEKAFPIEASKLLITEMEKRDEKKKKA